jgi:hypothetical protein
MNELLFFSYFSIITETGPNWKRFTMATSVTRTPDVNTPVMESSLMEMRRCRWLSKTQRNEGVKISKANAWSMVSNATTNKCPGRLYDTHT